MNTFSLLLDFSAAPTAQEEANTHKFGTGIQIFW